MIKQAAGALMDLTASDSLVVENLDDVAVAYCYRRGGVGFSGLMILKGVERANTAPLHTFHQGLAPAVWGDTREHSQPMADLICYNEFSCESKSLRDVEQAEVE